MYSFPARIILQINDIFVLEGKNATAFHFCLVDFASVIEVCSGGEKIVFSLLREELLELEIKISR